MTIRSPRRWRHPRRWTAAVLLLTLFAVADLGVGVVAHHRVQAAVERALPGAHVSTRVGGRPVAAHLLRDELGSVGLDAQGVRLPAAGRTVDVAYLHATAHGVHGVRTGHRFRLDHVDGWVRLTWEELSRVTGAHFQLDGRGQVALTGTVPILGEQVDGSLTGSLVLDTATQQVRIDAPVASLDRVAVPADVVEGLVTRLANRFTLPAVTGLTWTSILARDDGVELSFVGNGLVFAA